mmetsp:Transcript_4335/g.15191  ORF Transcript_4335/g.15191 Transcript_4335/m.15191 type:complete len:285 (+) Transcript_4335:167-1021(+)
MMWLVEMESAMHGPWSRGRVVRTNTTVLTYRVASYADQPATLYSRAAAAGSAALMTPRPTMMTSEPRSPMTEAGVLYCWPRASPPASSCTPGVICTSPGSTGVFHVAGATDMNPITKSGCSAAILAAVSVYAPFASVPFELISASSSSPRPFGAPTCLSPSIIPPPGTTCALVRCDQSAMWYTPALYCPTTVFPMSANLRSSKMRKSCLSASSRSFGPKEGSKSGNRSTCVLRQQISGPTLSARAMSSAAVGTSAATHRLVRLRSMHSSSALPAEFLANVARSA